MITVNAESHISIYMVILYLLKVYLRLVSCDDIPVTCPNTARSELIDTASIYGCEYDSPETGYVTCDTSYVISSPVTYESAERTVYFHLVLKMLEEVPEDVNQYRSTTIYHCVGLLEFRVSSRPEFDFILNFNSSVIVGIMFGSRIEPHEEDFYRYCTVELLKDTAGLAEIEAHLKPWNSFRKLAFHLYALKFNWLQKLFIEYENPMATDWTHDLQNTSIQVLNITAKRITDGYDFTILLKHMPLMRELILVRLEVAEFHSETFIGMSNVESLIVRSSTLQGIPSSVERIPKLRILEISREGDGCTFTFPTQELSTLKLLEKINLEGNNITSISEKLPLLPRLRILNLRNCRISTLQENQFMYVPALEELYLSENLLTSLHENTFQNLHHLKILDISVNQLTSWPVLHCSSLHYLDLSWNSLDHIKNLGEMGTIVKDLKIKSNKIIEWDKNNTFTLPNSLINSICSNSIQEVHKQANASYVGSLASRTGNTSRLGNFLKSHLTSKSKIDGKENSNFLWVDYIDLSHNQIPVLTETMTKSLNGLHRLDLGGNPFECGDCRLMYFQIWLNTTSTAVTNLGTTNPLRCSNPVKRLGVPVTEIQFDEGECVEEKDRAWIYGVVPVIFMLFLVATTVGTIYKFRSQITYMMHLYEIRKRAQAFSESAYETYVFDSFICYSSKDRKFVLKRLAPLLEDGPEKYILCLHERDFPLGSRIVDNIVGSIQHSRKTIIVLSEEFVNSKWCNWELEMANHKMFNDDENFLILIKYGRLERNDLPRHLQFLMDTRTYLEWAEDQNENDEKMCKRLKRALGPSIFDTTKKKPPVLSEVIELY